MRVALRFTTRESGEQCATTSGQSATRMSSVVSYLAQLLLHSDRAPSSVEVLDEFGLTTSVVQDLKLDLISVSILDGASTIVAITKMPESLVSVSHYLYLSEKSQVVPYICTAIYQDRLQLLKLIFFSEKSIISLSIL